MPLQALRVGKDWWALAAAIILPTAIFVLIAIGLGWRDEQAAFTASTRARASLISENVDRRLDVTATGLRILATVRAIKERDWTDATSRAQEIAAISPGWLSVEMVDADTGQRLVNTTGAGGNSVADVRALAPAGEVIFSGTERNAAGRIVLRAQTLAVHSTGRTLITVDVDPAIVQRELVRLAPKDGVSAVVDQSGAFAARTQGWPERLGTPATPYVREAMRSATSGVYRGRTWEGLDNYSAFVTSPSTGLSTHVAISSTLIDQPHRRWLVALGLAALASIGLGGALTAIVLRAASVRRRAADRRDRSERLEAIGRLSSGIAHDFNNMLAIIVGSLDVAQRRLAAGNHDISRFIDNAQDGAKRAAELTKRLLTFSRNQLLAPAPIDPKELIASLQELLQRTLGERVRLALGLDPDTWMILADRSSLENAIVNLCINASDAMPSGGLLTVATSNRPGGSGGRRPRSDSVLISVTDEGSGMSEEVAARALEPFFTTKGVKGTGLGLSQVNAFVEQSGGRVRIRTAPGAGTTVELFLPRHAAAVEPDATSPTPGDVSRANGEVLLVVDDEADVRSVTAAMLRDLGYEVIEASGGEDALAKIEQEASVALLVTDIVMPGMDGRTLAARPEIRRRGIPSLLISGFDPDGTGSDAVLAKPFTADVLAQRVRAAINRG